MIILTDLSEVLIRGIYGTENLIEQQYGKRIVKKYLKRREELNDVFCEVMRGHIPEDVYWHVFLHDGEWPFDADELKTILSMNLAETIPGTLSVYQRIIGHPYSFKKGPRFHIVGRPDFWLVSDHIAEREEELWYLHPEIFSLISRKVWSFERSKLKSDKDFFAELLRGSDVDKDKLLFIDDMVVNVLAADKAGIKSILFTNAKQLEEDLESLGFAFADTVQEGMDYNTYLNS